VLMGKTILVLMDFGQKTEFVIIRATAI
jgi:hypothetical protein